MYELPELEIIRAVIAEKYAGAAITQVKADKKAISSSLAAFKEQLVHHTIWFVERRTSHLIFHLDSGLRLVIYMPNEAAFYGGNKTEEKEPASDFIIYFGERFAAFSGLEVKSVRLLTIRQIEDELREFGPDPLDKRFTKSYLFSYIAKKRSSLKTLLLDPQFVTGIGPIYSDEILYAARLLPSRKANALTEQETNDLYEAMRSVMKEAVADGGALQQPLFAQDSFTGSYADKLMVYQKQGEACANCGHNISMQTVAKQKCNVCEHCQQ